MAKFWMVTVAANPYIAAITAELARGGITKHEIQYRGSHPRIIFQHDGRERFYVFPNSPSDNRRGILNAVADIRKMIGLKATKRKNHAAKALEKQSISSGPTTAAPRDEL